LNPGNPHLITPVCYWRHCPCFVIRCPTFGATGSHAHWRQPFSAFANPLAVLLGSRERIPLLRPISQLHSIFVYTITNTADGLSRECASNVRPCTVIYCGPIFLRLVGLTIQHYCIFPYSAIFSYMLICASLWNIHEAYSAGSDSIYTPFPAPHPTPLLFPNLLRRAYFS
jgi:hypothetical protein